VLWGKYDTSFDVGEAEAYRRDVPTAEVNILDAGHFVLDEQPDEVIQLVEDFMERQNLR
jgi:pimeloyl-ACP methyl ester carboxylesterase